MSLSSSVIVHITSDGERWDLLAWTYYGDPTLMSPIIFANPVIPIEAVFESGLRIYVPIIEASAASKANLPPWKRVSN
jgi:phage tail protein X